MEFTGKTLVERTTPGTMQSVKEKGETNSRDDTYIASGLYQRALRDASVMKGSY